MGFKGDLVTALAIELQRADVGGLTNGATARETAALILAGMFRRAGTDPCFVKAAADEPIFVLRAKDRVAPGAIRDWAHRATGTGAPDVKVREATDHAVLMERWQRDRGCKTPD
jgi:hypothetical protein